MNGLQLSRAYFEEYGRKMLEADFADILPYIAVGAVGSGSDRYGFDDEISRDHDYEPGFCIFIPGDDVIDRGRAFKLERAYAKLPKEFMGCVRQNVSPVGGIRNGIITIAEFYERAVGAPDGELNINQWLTLPDYALSEAVNGEIYFDNYGEFTRIRETLINMPRDIKLKRIAGNLLIMAQAGQYNYVRCLKHGEPEAAHIACSEFAGAAMKALFLLNDQYMPYYKWSFKAFKSMINNYEELPDKLSYILLRDHTDDTVAKEKYFVIEDVASAVITLLQENNLTDAICADLEKHAYSVNDKIADGNIRNLHILSAV